MKIYIVENRAFGGNIEEILSVHDSELGAKDFIAQYVERKEKQEGYSPFTRASLYVSEHELNRP